MKVFACKNDNSYGGGLIMVAANSVEEAFITAAKNRNINYLFDWTNSKGRWIKPDWKIEHCSCSTYPLKKWFEMPNLHSDLTEPAVIIEDHYSE